jgi:hypothetical protein
VRSPEPTDAELASAPAPNAKLNTRYMKRSARTIATTTVTITSLTG